MWTDEAEFNASSFNFPLNLKTIQFCRSAHIDAVIPPKTTSSSVLILSTKVSHRGQVDNRIKSSALRLDKLEQHYPILTAPSMMTAAFLRWAKIETDKKESLYSIKNRSNAQYVVEHGWKGGRARVRRNEERTIQFLTLRPIIRSRPSIENLIELAAV